MVQFGQLRAKIRRPYIVKDELNCQGVFKINYLRILVELSGGYYKKLTESIVDDVENFLGEHGIHVDIKKCDIRKTLHKLQEYGPVVLPLLYGEALDFQQVEKEKEELPIEMVI